MAVTIKDRNNFEYGLIPGFSDGDRDQMDPCFAAFKRIKQIFARGRNQDDWAVNMKLIGKASVRTDVLWISDDEFRKMNKFYRDKESNFMIETLQIFYFNIVSISDEDIELINKISPKILEFYGDKWTVKNIKSLGLINCTKINVTLKYENL